jgi:hypothetical protein
MRLHCGGGADGSVHPNAFTVKTPVPHRENTVNRRARTVISPQKRGRFTVNPRCFAGACQR